MVGEMVAHWVWGAMVTQLAVPHSEEAEAGFHPSLSAGCVSALVCHEDTQSLRHKRFCPQYRLSLCIKKWCMHTTPNCKNWVMQESRDRYMWDLWTWWKCHGLGQAILLFSAIRDDVLCFKVAINSSCANQSHQRLWSRDHTVIGVWTAKAL